MPALLLPNKPPPVLLFEPPKILPPVFVLEPKPGDAGSELDIFQLRGTALSDRCTVSTVSRRHAGLGEKREVCLPPLVLLLLLDPKPPNVDWVLLLEPKPPKPPDPKDMVGCRYEVRVYVFSRSDVRARRVWARRRLRAGVEMEYER